MVSCHKKWFRFAASIYRNQKRSGTFLGVFNIAHETRKAATPRKISAPDDNEIKANLRLSCTNWWKGKSKKSLRWTELSLLLIQIGRYQIDVCLSNALYERNKLVILFFKNRNIKLCDGFFIYQNPSNTFNAYQLLHYAEDNWFR